MVPALYDAAALSGAGWSSLVARRAHNPKVVGSNPTPATIPVLAARYQLLLVGRLLAAALWPVQHQMQRIPRRGISRFQASRSPYRSR